MTTPRIVACVGLLLRATPLQQLHPFIIVSQPENNALPIRD